MNVNDSGRRFECLVVVWRTDLEWIFLLSFFKYLFLLVTEQICRKCLPSFTDSLRFRLKSAERVNMRYRLYYALWSRGREFKCLKLPRREHHNPSSLKIPRSVSDKYSFSVIDWKCESGNCTSIGNVTLLKMAGKWIASPRGSRERGVTVLGFQFFFIFLFWPLVLTIG